MVSPRWKEHEAKMSTRQITEVRSMTFFAAGGQERLRQAVNDF
jgi:hypothetical protein